MEAIKIKGRIIEVGQVENVTDTFKKRILAISVVDGEYTQQIVVEAAQDKVSLLDGLKVGEETTVFVNLRGRSYVNKNTGKTGYFNTLQFWKVESDF